MKLLKIVGILCLSSLLIFIVPVIKVQALSEVVELDKIETEIEIKFTSSNRTYCSLEVGSSLEVNGWITPSPSNDVNIVLTYIPQRGELINYTVLTSSGFFNHTFSPGTVGNWVVTASWDGDEECEGAVSKTLHIKVTQQTWIVMILFFSIGAIFILVSLFIARPYTKRRFHLLPKKNK
ncbi:MAG: hypothetical protein L6N96_04540 [Candidatus Methylarchaceae archaeon HK02M2]|nr:hypothetical protein [Candidatus Methylarchaceae archaeon HK02M2]